MTKESLEVRLARIEEGQKQTHLLLRQYHAEVVLLNKKTQDNHEDITNLKRDRVWVSALAGVVFSWLGLKVFGKGG